MVYSVFGKQLVCFGCGTKSPRKQDGSIRQWKCDNCDSMNFLDENGEIADVPASPQVRKSQPVKYAHAIPRSTSPVMPSPDGPLFCTTCLKNHNLVNQALASYLPPPTDPRYHEYEVQYPAYRRRLEEQYPPMCADCEPIVRQRLLQTGYAAKTDHLRRMIQRTKGGNTRRRSTGWDWRQVVLLVGAFAWWMGLVTQLLWNFIGAFPQSENEEILGARAADTNILACLREITQSFSVNSGCVSAVSPLATRSLLLSLVSIWWNNKLADKVNGLGYGGRMVGLADYYKVQAVVLGARFAVLQLLRSPTLGLSLEATRGVHIFMIAFITLSTIFSLRLVRIDHTQVNFRQTFGESFQDSQLPSNLHARQRAKPTPPASQVNAAVSLSHSFPINQLAPLPRQPQPATPGYNPPTPPPDDYDDDNAMDWTPSQESFAPQASLNRPHTLPFKPIESNPFQTTVPRAPKPEFPHMRRAIQPSSQAAPEVKKRNNFFGKIRKTSSSFMDTLNGSFDQQPRQQNHLLLGQEHFYPSSKEGQDTGLEGLFNVAFSLGEEPPEIGGSQDTTSEQPSQIIIGISRFWYSAAGLLVHLAASAIWLSVRWYPSLGTPLRLTSTVLIIGYIILGGRAYTPENGVELLPTLLLAGLTLFLSAPVFLELLDLGGNLFLTAMAVNCIYRTFTEREASGPQIIRTSPALQTFAAQDQLLSAPQLDEPPLVVPSTPLRGFTLDDSSVTSTPMASPAPSVSTVWEEPVRMGMAGFEVPGGGRELRSRSKGRRSDVSGFGALRL